MTKHNSVIDLDINELAALLISQGEAGTDAMISLLDESLSSIGPLANLLVQNAMSFEDRTDEYQLTRNYTGTILNNKLISTKIKKLGFDIMSDRGIIDDDGEFTNPIVNPISQILSNPQRVIHNVTLLAEFDRSKFVARFAQSMTQEEAEKKVPLEPPNGYSYPVTAYVAVIISTEQGGVVIAPNNFNSMLFDLQIIPPMPVGSFVKELVETAAAIELGSSSKTIIYGVKLPGGTEINTVAFFDKDSGWSGAFVDPEDDIDYITFSDSSGNEMAGFLIASNKTDLLDANKNRGVNLLPDLDTMSDYMAKLSIVPLAKRVEVNDTITNDPKE